MDFAGAGGFGYFYSAAIGDGFGAGVSSIDIAFFAFVCAIDTALSGAGFGTGLYRVVVLSVAFFHHSFHSFRRMGNAFFPVRIRHRQMADKFINKYIVIPAKARNGGL